MTDAPELAARVLAHVDAGVLLVDAQGVVRLWNRAAETITGLAAADLVGHASADVIPGWAALTRRVAAAGSPERAEPRTVTVLLALAGGELELAVSAVRSRDGVVYTFRDAGAEREAGAMRREFLTMVAHELKTPLASIHGAATTLRRSGELGEAGRDRLLEIMAGESSRLQRVVNDLLAAGSLESGRLEVVVEACDAAAAVSDVVEAARFRVPAGAALEAELPDRLPPVAADPDRLRQVLVNLVDNAARHSPEGAAVRVAVETLGDRVRFAVRDEGPGVPRGVRARIFEKYFRYDAGTQGTGGTGLGLYVSREIVQMMGGRIWVDSDQGEGSTFRFELPAAGEAT